MRIRLVNKVKWAYGFFESIDIAMPQVKRSLHVTELILTLSYFALYSG